MWKNIKILRFPDGFAQQLRRDLSSAPGNPKKNKLFLQNRKFKLFHNFFL